MTNETPAQMEARHKARLEQIDAVYAIKELVGDLKHAAIRFGVSATQESRWEMRDAEAKLEARLWTETAALLKHEGEGK